MTASIRIRRLCTTFGISVFVFALLLSMAATFAEINEASSLENLTLAELNSSPGLTNRTPIYLGGFFSLGANEGNAWDTSGILAAVEMAIEHVNDRGDILVDYELQLVWNDTKCDAEPAIQGLFDQLFYKPQKTLIIGPGCSTATQEVAKVADYWNLVTMSYAASSPLLSDKDQYPLFYRTCPPDDGLNPARVELVKRFNWSRVATIHESHELFSLAIDDLVQQLIEANVTIITSESVAGDPAYQVENLKKQDARIIIANMYENVARKIFCEAYKQNMTGEGYAWLILGWYTAGWYLADDETISCSPDEMKAAVEGSLYIGTEFSTLAMSDEPSIAGMTVQDYETAIRNRLLRYPTYIYNSQGPYGYDAVWAIALMLNRSVETLETHEFSDGNPRRLEDFDYGDRELSKIFFELLNTTEFMGLSGYVSFSGGDREGTVVMEQLQPTSCTGEDQLHTGPECLSLFSSPQTWATAGECCVSDVGSNAILAAVHDYDQLVDIWSKINASFPDSSSTTWYTGLYLNETKHVISTGINYPELNELRVINTLNLSNSCVAVDFESNYSLIAVNCSEELPYICAQPDFSEHYLGLYNPYSRSFDLDADFIWPGDGGIPADSSPVTREVIVRPVIYFALVMSLAVICILIALCFLVFNIKFRNQKYIRLSSPNINNLIIVGCILMYAWVILFSLDFNIVGMDALLSLCKSRVWILSAGFVTAFGALLCKTWRVYQIAAFKTPRRRTIRDSQLFAMLIMIVLIDVIILMIWNIIDPLVLVEVEVHDHEYTDLTVVHIDLICSSYYTKSGFVVMISYKVLLVLYGAFLAWSTRKVRIPALNDSKLISFCVLTAVFLFVIGGAVCYSLRAISTAFFIFAIGIVTLMASLLLGMIFLPKIISVYKDPTGENALGNVQPPSFPSGNISTDNICEDVNLKLQNKILELEDKLEEMTAKAAMADYTGPTSCGVWCFGLSCGCTSGGGCGALDDDDDEDNVNGSACAYEVKLKESSNFNMVHVAHERSDSIVYTSGEDILTEMDAAPSTSGI